MKILRSKTAPIKLIILLNLVDLKFIKLFQYLLYLFLVEKKSVAICK